MTWPTQITVTTTFTLADGTPAQGTVVFQLAKQLVNPGVETVGTTPKIAKIGPKGQLSYAVAASNDPPTVPTGVFYIVTIRLKGATPVTRHVVIPYTAPGHTVKLSSLVTVTPTNFNLTEFLANPGGGTTTEVLTQDKTAPFGYRWAPSSGGGGGGLLAAIQPVPNTLTIGTRIMGDSTTLINLTPTKLSITFVAPASGDVLIALTGVPFPRKTPTSVVAWALTVNGVTVGEQFICLGITGHTLTSPVTYRQLLTGLTPGNTYTVKWMGKLSIPHILNGALYYTQGNATYGSAPCTMTAEAA